MIRMPLKGSDPLTGGYIPELEGLIKATRQYHASVWGKGYRINRFRMPIKGSNLLTGGYIPEF